MVPSPPAQPRRRSPAGLRATDGLKMGCPFCGALIGTVRVLRGQLQITGRLSDSYIESGRAARCGHQRRRVRDVAGLKKFVATFRAAFPDGRFKVEDMLTDGEKVVCRFSVTGTHRGDFMGMASTGKALKISGIDIIQFANGKAIEHWGEFDGLGMLRQLGVMPSEG